MDQLTSMRMNPNPVSGQKSPHKAVMMLAVFDLIASGEATENRIVYGPELLEHFRRYLDDRIDAQRSLIDLNGKSILFPEQKQFAPKPDALLWRGNRLKAG